MRVSLVRTGGLAGLRRVAVLDTASLEPGREARLRQLLEAAERAELSSAALAPAPAPEQSRDRFRYVLTVEEEGRRREFHFAEEDVGHPLRAFLEAVWRHSDPDPYPSGSA